MKTNFDLVHDTDPFPYGEGDLQVNGEKIYTLRWEDDDGEYSIGYVLGRVVEEINKLSHSIIGDVQVDHDKRTIKLFRQATEAERSTTVAAVCDHFRENKVFKLLERWRGELWPVYGRKGELLFSMERAAVGLIGAVRYGVHLTAYVEDVDAPYGLKIWVPRRAVDKSTFPGMLDNTVAGGLMTGEDQFECMIREADEEASLPEELVRARAQPVSTVTYISITEEQNYGEAGFIYPECEWVYDLPLPSHISPQPKDGEVAEFSLCSVDQVKEDLAAGRYKTNCAVVILDFFIRHGILTADNEPNIEILKQRMHRELPFPGPHQSHWHSVSDA